jgi:formylglycine-generating enzyme required for sulfatase activity
VSIVAPPTPALWEIALFGSSRQREYVDWLRAQPRAHSRAKSTARCDNAADRTNDLGIVDLIGNVWEWCVDDYEWRWFTYGQSERVRKRPEYSGPTVIAGPTLGVSLDYIGGRRSKAWLKGGGFYDDLDEIDLTVNADDIAGGQDSRHADVGFRWSAVVPLSRLPTELQQLLKVSPPLSSRSGRSLVAR